MVYTKTINDSMIINFDYVYHHLLSRINHRDSVESMS